MVDLAAIARHPAAGDDAARVAGEERCPLCSGGEALAAAEGEDGTAVIEGVIREWEAHRGDFPNYEAGTWGPASADELLARDGHVWRRL